MAFLETKNPLSGVFGLACIWYNMKYEYKIFDIDPVIGQLLFELIAIRICPGSAGADCDIA